MMIAYGPVPSRRLGRSLGVNNIPPKSCTYRCVYCQVGRTRDLHPKRRAFFPPEEIARDVARRMMEIGRAGEIVNYLSFVPDGEPTLDVDLARTMKLLRAHDLPIAVITNGSLLTLPDVRRDLAQADLVSIKVDTVEAGTWQRLNRPHKRLRLPDILAGMTVFSHEFSGKLITETMLIAGINDTPEHARDTASFLERLQPDKAYLSVPTRPPAEPWILQPNSKAIVAFHEEFTSRLAEVECLLGYEGSDFSAAGDPRQSLLSITAVHPMRTDAVAKLLYASGADWSVVEDLLAEERMRTAVHDGHLYYLPALAWQETDPP